MKASANYFEFNIMNTCPMCDKEKISATLPYNDTGWTDWGIFTKLKISYCISCGFGSSVPELEGGLVNDFYETKYRSKDSTFHIDFSKLPSFKGLGDVRDDRAFSQVSLARAFCDFNNEDIFLDIGPGKGGSFGVAKTLFNNPKIHSIELSTGAESHYRENYDAYSHNSINDFISLNLKAQVLLMSHSLEHYRLSDLPELFLSISLALAENGVAIIEVPHVDLRIHAENRGVDTPHFLFFSKESLVLLGEKYFFDVLFIDTCGPTYPSLDEFLASNAKSSKRKDYLKQNFNKLPKSFRLILRMLVRAFKKAKNVKLIRKNNLLKTLPQLSYGGNRQCLRMVIRNKAVNSD